MITIFMLFNNHNKKRLSTIKQALFASALALFLFVPSLVSATPIVNTDPVPLNFAPPCLNVPGMPDCASPVTTATTFQDYLVRLYQFAVGISGIVAVGMIVWGSIYISAFTESIDKKSEGREMITSAIIGIMLLLGSYLLLRTINPRIVALGESLTPQSVPQNLTATTTQQMGPSACADPSTIQGAAHTPIDFNVYPTSTLNTCAYRRLYIYKDGLRISSDDNDYYDTTLGINVDLKPNSIIWVYPYMKSGDPASARCIIYAYKEPGDPGSTFTSLQTTIEPCVLPPDKQQQPGYMGPVGAEGAGSGGTAPAETVQQALTLTGGSVNFSNSADCRPAESSALGVITSLQQRTLPVVCHNGCKTDGIPCAANGVYPDASMMGFMNYLKNQKVSATVTSITGGDHAANSEHYQGRAIDVTTSGGIDAYNAIITKASTYGVSAYCEYADPAYGGAVKLHKTCSTSAAGVPNLHLHIQTAPNGNAVP